MTDNATQLAQSAAERLSRRSFLGCFGRTATIAAAALGGIVMIPDQAQAGKRCFSWTDCPKAQSCYNGRCRRSRKA